MSPTTKAENKNGIHSKEEKHELPRTDTPPPFFFNFFLFPPPAALPYHVTGYELLYAVRCRHLVVTGSKALMAFTVFNLYVV